MYGTTEEHRWGVDESTDRIAGTSFDLEKVLASEEKLFQVWTDEEIDESSFH